MPGMVQTATASLISRGDVSFTITSATGLKPGMGIIVGDGRLNEWKTVPLTYVGSTTVPVDSPFQHGHAIGASVQYDGNNAPGLTGS